MRSLHINVLKNFTLPIWVIYLNLCLIIGGLYTLPFIFPASIGTLYIIFCTLMLVLSLSLYWIPSPSLASSAPPPPSKAQPIDPKTVLYLSLIILIALFPLSPLTSNDSQRYLWDGAVFMAGFDPYITAPNDGVVSELRTLWPTPPEHEKYPTLYPPGAMILFGLASLGRPIYGFWIWKFIVTLGACASLIFMYKLLARRGQLNAFVLFAFNPIFLFEIGIGTHLDGICLLGIIAALLVIHKEKFIMAGVIIGLAATVKFLPAIMIGPFLFYLKPKQAMQLCLSAMMTFLTIYGLIFMLGYKPIGLLPVFFETWRGGAPLFPILDGIRTSLGLSGLYFLISLLCLAVIGFALSARMASKGYIETALMISFLVPLLLSPILFPWYLLALIPIWVLKPNMTGLACIALAPLSYEVLNQWLSKAVWDQADWPHYILLGGLIIGFAYDYRRQKQPA